MYVKNSEGMWGSAEKAGTVFLKFSASPLKWAPPPKRVAPLKGGQNSKFMKTKIIIYFLF